MSYVEPSASRASPSDSEAASMHELICPASMLSIIACNLHVARRNRVSAAEALIPSCSPIWLKLMPSRVRSNTTVRSAGAKISSARRNTACRSACCVTPSAAAVTARLRSRSTTTSSDIGWSRAMSRRCRRKKSFRSRIVFSTMTVSRRRNSASRATRILGPSVQKRSKASCTMSLLSRRARNCCPSRALALFRIHGSCRRINSSTASRLPAYQLSSNRVLDKLFGDVGGSSFTATARYSTGAAEREIRRHTEV